MLIADSSGELCLPGLPFWQVPCLDKQLLVEFSDGFHLRQTHAVRVNALGCFRMLSFLCYIYLPIMRSLTCGKRYLGARPLVCAMRSVCCFSAGWFQQCQRLMVWRWHATVCEPHVVIIHKQHRCPFGAHITVIERPHRFTDPRRRRDAAITANINLARGEQ